METTITRGELKTLPNLNLPDKEGIKPFIEILSQNIEILGLNIKKSETVFFLDTPDRLTIQLEIIGQLTANYIVRFVISKINDEYYIRFNVAVYNITTSAKTNYFPSERMSLKKFEENFESMMNLLILK